METTYTTPDLDKVYSNDGIRVGQTASGEFAIHQFKDYMGSSSSCTLTWDGQSDYAPSSSAVKLQIYNNDTDTWSDVDFDNETGANTDFLLTGVIADLTDYKDAQDIITCRVYQEGP